MQLKLVYNKNICIIEQKNFGTLERFKELKKTSAIYYHIIDL